MLGLKGFRYAPGTKCENLLKTHMLQTLKDFYPQGDSVFQQGNATCHSSKKIHELLQTQRMILLDGPLNSPDHNPFESLWKIVKQRLIHCTA